MECWSVGVLECWSVGVLECWSVGVLHCVGIAPDGRGLPVAVRRLPIRVNLSGRGAPDGEGALPVRRSLWSYGHLRLRSAKLDPARREDVPEANGAFSSLIREGYGLRERRIARTRSLPALGWRLRVEPRNACSLRAYHRADRTTNLIGQSPLPEARIRRAP
jgi:hypothetical protein